jgi:hypothetical protein
MFVDVARYSAMFSTYIPEYLLAQCSPAMLERMEAALTAEVASLRGCTRVDTQKSYVQVRLWVVGIIGEG